MLRTILLLLAGCTIAAVAVALWAVLILWAGIGLTNAYGFPRMSYGDALWIAPLFVALSGAALKASR